MLQYYICLGIVLTVILVLGLGLGFGIILYFVIGTWSNGPILYSEIGFVWLHVHMYIYNNNIIIIYKSCTLQRSVWRNMAGSRAKQRTVRSNYVYRSVRTCKSLKRDVHEQMCCGYNDSTINTYSSTAFAANRLKMVRRHCKHPTRLHIERFAASIYSRPYFSRQSVARCKICI